jgi:hypothetical protein
MLLGLRSTMNFTSSLLQTDMTFHVVLIMSTIKQLNGKSTHTLSKLPKFVNVPPIKAIRVTEVYPKKNHIINFIFFLIF